MDKLAWVLDGAIPIPGTRFRFGLDSIIGLIPGVGDVLGLLIGAALLYEGLRIGAPRALILKMLGNSALDAAVGAVPVLGDLFDFAFKSNQRNARLLRDHLEALEAVQAPPPARRSRTLSLSLLAAAVLVLLCLLWLIWSQGLARSPAGAAARGGGQVLPYGLTLPSASRHGPGNGPQSGSRRPDFP